MILQQRCSLRKAFTQPLARIAPTTHTFRFRTPRRLHSLLTARGVSSFPYHPSAKNWQCQHSFQRPDPSIRGIATWELPESPYDTETWPTHMRAMKRARRFLVECAAEHGAVLLVTERRCRSMSAATILRQTLLKLGKSPEKIWVLIRGEERWPYDPKDLKDEDGSSVDVKEAKYAIFVNPSQHQVPKSSPLNASLLDGDLKSSIILSDDEEVIEFPDWAEVLTASQSPPVASSILAYILCSPLLSSTSDYWYEKAEAVFVWLAFIGSLGGGNAKYNFEQDLYPPGLNSLRDGQKWMKKLVTMLDGLAMHRDGDLTTGWRFLQTVSDAQILVPPQDLKELFHEARVIFNNSIGKDCNLTARGTYTKPHEKDILSLLHTCIEKEHMLESVTDELGTSPLSLTQSWDKQVIVGTIDTPFRVENAIAASMATKPMRCSLVACANMSYVDTDGMVYYSFRQLNDEPLHNAIKRTRKESKTHGMVKDIAGLLREYASRDKEFSQRLREAEEAKEVVFSKSVGRVIKGNLTVELWNVFMHKCLSMGPPWTYNLERTKKHLDQPQLGQKDQPQRKQKDQLQQKRKPQDSSSDITSSKQSTKQRSEPQPYYYSLFKKPQSQKPIEPEEDGVVVDMNDPQEGDNSNTSSRPRRSAALWKEIEYMINQNSTQSSGDVNKEAVSSQPLGPSNKLTRR